jgi:hypothetical protein
MFIDNVEDCQGYLHICLTHSPNHYTSLLSNTKDIANSKRNQERKQELRLEPGPERLTEVGWAEHDM